MVGELFGQIGAFWVAVIGWLAAADLAKGYRLRMEVLVLALMGTAYWFGFMLAVAL